MFVPHIDAVMDRQSYRRTDGRLTERLTERERERESRLQLQEASQGNIKEIKEGVMFSFLFHNIRTTVSTLKIPEK